uniref:Uncharacterized protein n=2 Tax=viral metagenome TaxID=1070528 RepID=A0A6M3INW5_9ZZZZ
MAVTKVKARMVGANKLSADHVIMKQVNAHIRKYENRVVDFPEAVSGQTELNRLKRRTMNGVIAFPRGDNGEFALLEKVRRLDLNRLLSIPRADHGEFALLEVIRLRKENRILSFPLLADGTTPGKIKTTNITDYSIAGQVYTKAATDDLWDLSAFTPDTGAAEYEAVVLWLDAAGTATTSKLALAASEAAALALVDASIVSNPTLCCVGVYVAGLSTDWNGGAGLDSFGTYYNGYPAARTTVAVTAETETLVGDGTTAGKAQLLERIAFTVGGQVVYKAATDDLWDMSGYVDVGAAKFRAVALCLDVSGAAVLVPGTDQDSAALGFAEVGALVPATSTVIAMYVGGNSADWDDAGGLAGQGTFYQSWQDDMAPAAVTAESTTRLADGSTAGKIKLNQKIHYLNDGQLYSIAVTDDFWDVSGYVDVGAAKYRAVALGVNNGVAVLIPGTDQDSANLALAEVAALESTGVCIVGYYVGGNSADWDDAGGLAGQGTYYQSPPEVTVMADAVVAGTSILSDGSTAGKIKLAAGISYKNDGQSYSKALTDDFWDLSAETDTTAVQYRAYLLCIDGGVASVVSGGNAASAALAIAAAKLLIPESKCVVGLYVADPSTDFDGGAGLDSFGTYYDSQTEAMAIAEIEQSI